MSGKRQSDWESTLRPRPPVSRWRRWASVVLLALLLAGVFAYHRFSDEQRLRGYAQAWLQDFTGGDVRIDSVRFDSFEWLHLVGVTVAAPVSAHFDPGDNSLAARTVFRAASVSLRLRPLSVMTGRLAVPEVVALDPQLTLARRLVDGRWNWEMLFRNRAKLRPDEVVRLPEVRLRNAELVQIRLDDRGRVRGRPQRIGVNARPKANKPDCYEVEVTKLFGQPDDPQITREMTRIELDVRTAEVSGSLPSMAMEDLLLTAPVEVAEWLDVCGLRGYVRADNFRHDPSDGAAFLLTLRDVSMSLPIDDAERSLPADQRYLKFDGVGGTIRFDRREAQIALEGRFRSHPLTMKGKFELGTGDDWAATGFDIEAVVSGLQLPRNADAKDPAERRLVQSLPVIAEQIEDFDGIGAVDVRLHLRRQARAGAVVELVEGAVDFKGCSARYIGFPYRLSDLSGRIWIRPDTRIELLNLVGRHGNAKATINGLLGGRVSNEGDLRISGEGILLDDDLLVCLDERDRSLIRRFNATARADVEVQMHRPATPVDRPAEQWKTQVDIRLVDGTLNMVDFPYPFERLSGRLRIGDGRVEVSEFCGRHGDLRACVSGVAEDAGEKGFGYDLELTATGVVLDDTLKSAMPDIGRRLFEKYQPAGRGTVTGRLFTPEPGAAGECDLRAVLTDGSLGLQGTGERISQCHAVLRIRPDIMAVESLDGRFGESAITADGRIPLRSDDADMSLHLRSERMLLDARLRSVLPEAAQAVWDDFQPEGYAAFDLRFGPEAAGSRPASAPAMGLPSSRPAVATQPVSRAPEYSLVIEPADCGIRYSGFPLPLTNLNGRFLVTPGRVIIERFKARHERATFEGVGAVDLAPERTLVALTLDARELALSEPLRKALPWRLRRLWGDLRPAGTLDLSFEKLLLTCPAGKQVTWTFDGSARLRDVALTLGPELKSIHGEIRAGGEVGEEFAIQGDLKWSEARIEGWRISDVTASFSRPVRSGCLRLSQLMAEFYGGRVIADVEIKDSPRGSEFGLSLTARDVSLGDFLNGRLVPGEKPVAAKGVVDGSLSLAGRLGDYKSRHGGGTVLIHHAQMLKLPFILAIMQVVHLAIDDDNAFHDARLSFRVDGDDLLFQEIDLRGKAVSMVGAGRVNTPTEALDLVLLVGSPIKLPRMEVLSELMEGLARELVEVHVEGKLSQPTFRAEIVRSIRRTVDTIFNAREKRRR